MATTTSTLFKSTGLPLNTATNWSTSDSSSIPAANPPGSLTLATFGALTPTTGTFTVPASTFLDWGAISHTSVGPATVSIEAANTSTRGINVNAVDASGYGIYVAANKTLSVECRTTFPSGNNGASIFVDAGGFFQSAWSSTGTTSQDFFSIPANTTIYKDGAGSLRMGSAGSTCNPNLYGTIEVRNGTFVMYGTRVGGRGTLSLAAGTGNTVQIQNFGAGTNLFAFLNYYIKNGFTSSGTINNTFASTTGFSETANVYLSGSGQKIIQTDITLNIQPVIADDPATPSPGGITKRGTASLNLTSANTFTGPTRVEAGTLTVSSTNGLRYSVLDWGTATVGTISWAGTQTIGGLSSASGTARAFTPSTGMNIGFANTNETFAGTLSGTASISKVGTGSWTLSGNTGTSYTGSITVTGGELVLRSGLALGNGTGTTIGALGTLTVDGQISVASIPTTLAGTLRAKNGGVAGNDYYGDITVSSATTKIENVTASTTFRVQGNVAVGASTLTITGAGNTSVGLGTANVTTSSTGTVNWTGTGTLTFQTSNWSTNFLGTLNLQSGTFVTSSTVFGSTAGNVNINGATFRTTSSLTFANGVTGTGGTYEYTGSSNGTLTLGAGRSSEWGGYFVQSGTGNLSLIAQGTIILRGTTNSTYSGVTRIPSGYAGSFDSAHSFLNSDVSSLSSAGTLFGAGGWNGTTGGLGDFGMKSLSFTYGGTLRSSKKDAATTPSKLAITGTFARSSSSVSVIGAGTGWVAGTEYLVASFASTTGTGTISAGTWADSVNARIGNGTVRTTATAIYLTPAAANTTVTWAGGTSGGQWFNNQPSGWSGSSAPAFANGDTVVFNASSTVTATLTENVTVNGITMNAASHTVSGGFTLTNTSGLTIGGVFTQTLDTPMTHAGNIVIGTGSELLVTNASALTQSTGIVDMTAGAAKLTTSVSVTVSRQVSLPTTIAANTTFQKTGGTTLTLSGAVVDGANATNVNIVGSGVLHMNVGLPTNAVLRVVDNATTNGSNVFRTTNALNANSALVLGFAGIYETNQPTFSRAYGTSAGQVTCLNTGGGGFSSFSGSGLTVSTALTYGSSVVSQWSGPMYFGTALTTSQSKTTLSGAQNINEQTQTFHVFNGANANGSTGEISGKISGSGTITKAGPGTLIISNATNDFTASVTVSTGTLVTTNATVLNGQSVTLAASTTLQARTSSGTALNVNNLTTGTGSRIIIGA